MANQYEIGRKIGYKAAKYFYKTEQKMHLVDEKLHRFNHHVASGMEKAGLERKVVCESLKAASFLTFPYMFSAFVDPGVSSIILSSGIKQLKSDLQGASCAIAYFHPKKIHPLGNAYAYVRGVKSIFAGAITAAVGSYFHSEISHDLGITAMAIGSCLFLVSSANYIKRKIKPSTESREASKTQTKNYL